MMDNTEASFPIPSSQTKDYYEFDEYNSSPLFRIHVYSFFKNHLLKTTEVFLVSSARLHGLWAVGKPHLLKAYNIPDTILHPLHTLSPLSLIMALLFGHYHDSSFTDEETEVQTGPRSSSWSVTKEAYAHAHCVDAPPFVLPACSHSYNELPETRWLINHKMYSSSSVGGTLRSRHHLGEVRAFWVVDVLLCVQHGRRGD